MSDDAHWLALLSAVAPTPLPAGTSAIDALHHTSAAVAHMDPNDRTAALERVLSHIALGVRHALAKPPSTPAASGWDVFDITGPNTPLIASSRAAPIMPLANFHDSMPLANFHDSMPLANFHDSHSPAADQGSLCLVAPTDAPAVGESPLEKSTSIVSKERLPVPLMLTTHATRTADDAGFKILNQYVLQDTLGKGTSGKVKLAFDTERNTTVAIKIVRRRRTAGERQKLEREIAVMKRLRHKNLVSLYEVIDDPKSDKLYLVMQYVDDGPLVTVDPDTLTCTPMDAAAAVDAARQLTAGLAYLHSHRIVHRDIKPENILKSRDGTVYLADFGVSENATDKVSGWEGSPLFMAPEVHALRGSSDVESVDGYAADVYSLGVTLFLMLTGRLPFTTPGNEARAPLTFPGSLASEWHGVFEGMLGWASATRDDALETRRRVKSIQVTDPDEDVCAVSFTMLRDARTLRMVPLSTETEVWSPSTPNSFGHAGSPVRGGRGMMAIAVVPQKSEETEAPAAVAVRAEPHHSAAVAPLPLGYRVVSPRTRGFETAPRSTMERSGDLRSCDLTASPATFALLPQSGMGGPPARAASVKITSTSPIPRRLEPLPQGSELRRK